MILSIIESPFWDPRLEQREDFARYLDAALRHSIDLGEAPYASHALYTRALDDTMPEERALGLELGRRWERAAECLYAQGRNVIQAFYVDYGISPGMRLAWERPSNFPKVLRRIR
jgi:hypothetical protein